MPDQATNATAATKSDAAALASRSSLRGVLRRPPRALMRTLLWCAGIAYFGFAVLVLGLRYVVLPQADSYRGEIAQLLTQSLGLRVTVGGVDAYWHGLHPGLVLHQLQLFDKEDRPALAFDNVETELAWSSLFSWRLLLHRLELNAPVLSMRRDSNGHVFIAGIQLNTEQGGGDFSDWVLSQGSIIIRDATLRWEDAQRAAPPLELRRLNFRLENFGSRHRFGLTADPPPEMAARLDIRADLRGHELDRLSDWRGEAYFAVDHADLAVWRTWVNYPVELPRGSGALRLWLNLEAGRLAAATADVALQNLDLRLAGELPMLELAQISGRITARLPGAGLEVSARELAFETRDGMRLDPTEFLLRYTPTKGRTPARGELTASRLQLDAVHRLAAHLPLDETIGKKLMEYSPRGQLKDLKLAWSMQGSEADAAIHGYNLRARFEKLGIRPVGTIPGFAGLSGNIDASDKAGTATLSGRDAMVELPAVFPEPRMEFDQLAAQLGWTIDHGTLDVQLQSLAFNNKDVAGTASGRYRAKSGEPGTIDLNARLTHAEGAAAWRYLPFAVNPDTREWLRHSILGGKSDGARLRLKGDLANFPFVDGKSGIFQVTGKINNVTLRYAPDWPQLSEIAGDLLFEGKRMLIRAERGKISGVSISGVTAEIPNLIVAQEILRVKGKATGETAAFLRFIDASPVAARIEHFTQGMQAEGGGALQIQIALPLRHVRDATVEGEFGFNNNRIIADAGLPPLGEVNGKLHFTARDVTVRRLTANMLGAPLTLSATTPPEGGVAIAVQGGASVANLHQHFDSPILEHLSGNASWQGKLLVRRKTAELSIDSNLQGIASSLPEPFNKTAAEALPLHIERVAMPEGAAQRDGQTRDLVRISLGRTLNAQIVRRHQGGKTSVERGAIGIQEAASLPERGVLLSADMRALDLDQWRKTLHPDGETATLPVTAVALKAAEVTAFGRQFHEVNLRAVRENDKWQAKVSGRELAGDIVWGSQGRGRVSARLKQFSLVDAKMADTGAAEEPLRELPGADIVVENFILHGKQLGHLELVAENRDKAWAIEKLMIVSPDATLSGDGQWRHLPSTQESRLNFKLETGNVGKLLERLGYADAVRRGAARLEGKVSWNGPPTSIHLPTLSGTMSLDAKGGQFNKLDPGVGRLLGILSLQALPRRISLDFRDIFSEGFAFDSIGGDVNVTRGVMSTQNLQIRGPSAKIAMTGDVNLSNETQNLRVRVQPTLSETVAVGAALANPAVGLAALLAQKVLRDPIERMFSYEYAVTGSWVDPKVVKIEANTANKEE